MPLESWQEAELFGPPTGSLAAGAAPAPAAPPAGWGGGGGVDEFELPPGAGRGRASGTRGKGRGSKRGGATGGRGNPSKRPKGAAAAVAAARSGSGRDEFEWTQQPKGKQSGKKPYVPKKRSGASALLARLFINEQNGVLSADIQSLQADAQPFCDESMKVTGPIKSNKDYFCGWSAMSGLETKNLKDPDSFGGFINGSSGGNSNSNSNSSSSPNAFSPPRRSGGAAASSSSSSLAAGGTSKKASSSSSPVIVSLFAKSGGLRVQNPKGKGKVFLSPAAVSAEARREKEMAEKAARAAKAVATPSPAGVGSKRGRILQERGTEKFEKRSKLYGGGDAASGGGSSSSSPLADGLQFWSDPSKPTAAAAEEATATAAGKMPEACFADDQWQSLTSRPAQSRPVLKPSSPPLRRPVSGNVSKTTRVSPLPTPPRSSASSSSSGSSYGASGGPGVPPRAAAPSPSGPSSVDLSREKNIQRGVSTTPPPAATTTSRAAAVDLSEESSIPRCRSTTAAAAAAATTTSRAAPSPPGVCVVDMTLSDDEDEDIPVGGSDGGGEGVLMVPPPSYASAPGVGGGGGVEGSASSLSGGGSGGGGGGGGTAATAGGGCKGPGAGGVVPYREPTYYGSKTRGARAAAAGLSESGAISWRGRACPPWLQSELDAGTVSGTDRMMDVFDLVLVVDSNERFQDVRAPIQAKMHSFLSQGSLSRAGLHVPPTGVGLEMQAAKLQAGDFAWAWRRKRSGVRGTAIDAGAVEEVLMLDCLVERKTADDMVESIEKDKRYTAQKRRMRLSGLSRTIYLFEGDLENCRKATTGADKSKTARTAEVDTFAEGFVIKRVGSTQESAAFLLSLSLQLLASQGVETVKSFCDNPARPKVSLQGWNAAMHPYEFEPGTVNLTFAKCLVQMVGAGPEAAWAMADAFRTPTSFVKALRQCSTRSEQLDLVQHLTLADGGKKYSTRPIQKKVAEQMVSMFADEPQV